MSNKAGRMPKNQVFVIKLMGWEVYGISKHKIENRFAGFKMKSKFYVQEL